MYPARMPIIAFRRLHVDPLGAEPGSRIECAIDCDGLGCGLSSHPEHDPGPHWHVVIVSANDPEAQPWLLGVRNMD
jgi:hypothetical protein